MKNNVWFRTAVLSAAALCSTGAVLAQADATAAQDRMFLMKSSEGGMAEIDMSRLALKKSKNPDIQAYAKQMVDDHTMLIANMKPFADAMGVMPPATLNPSHKEEYARLKSKSGMSFDEEYVKAMVGDHHKDVGEFTTERDTTKNTDLQATVAKGTDVIRQHTEMIDGIASKMSIPTPPLPPATPIPSASPAN